MAELIWEGKYDKQDRRVAPSRVTLPFQTVETVNESAPQRQRALDLWSAGRPTEWRNRLIWGDKQYVLPALLEEFAGEVALIYIDPPFNVGSDFSFQVQIEGEEFTKAPSVIEQKAYRDTWGRGLDSYLQWFYDTAVLLRELLAQNGSMYVHLDWRMSHYIRVLLDEIFPEGFKNEIIWSYGGRGAKAIAGQFARNHDTLFLFTKGDNPKFNKVYAEHRVHLKDLGSSGFSLDEHGRPFKTAPRGDYTDKSIEVLRKQGRIHETRTGNVRIKYFLRQEGNYVIEDKLVGDVWDDIPDAMHLSSSEKTGYPTQKPEALLERIISASSNEGDLVLDCFAGSGTTAAVAERLGRRWLTCDLGRFAIHTTRKRLLSIPNVRPFVVQNLGKYERQAWRAAEFGDPQRAAATAAYRRFILDLYHARPIEGYTWLHGIKAGRMVHVGPVDSPISPADVRQIAIEFRRAMGTGQDAPTTNAVDVLGWDFAFELNEVAKQEADAANLRLHFVRIPREVLEQKAVEQGAIRFFGLAALAVDVQQKGRTVTLKLTDFVIPPDDVPADVQAAITHWSQWIDYWAVDWDNRGDTFHNMWQSYRTRKEPKLQLQIAHPYTEPGDYRIMVKVIDIVGNDTIKTLEVKVV